MNAPELFLLATSKVYCGDCETAEFASAASHVEFMDARRVTPFFVRDAKDCLGQLLLLRWVIGHDQFHRGLVNINRFSFHYALTFLNHRFFIYAPVCHAC
jgi:hypothetical protein